jgi:hypothetical protein
MNQSIGLLMLLTPFIALFILEWKLDGFKFILFVYIGTALLLSWVAFGVLLLKGAI